MEEPSNKNYRTSFGTIESKVYYDQFVNQIKTTI